MEDLTIAIHINPKSYDAYNERGNLKMRAEDYTGAIIDFNKAIELNPNYCEAYNNRGVAKIFSNTKQEGCADLQKALQLGCDGAKKAINDLCK